ncbi:MAG: AAA family ATPase [Gammaproteobacteria bacterium]|nr:AAA family ATPase [Gammaproteobacteria bacterium]
MKINRFEVENYRSFVERTVIELKPLTLLFGYNNAGKSALLRALPLLADSLDSKAGTPLNLKSPALRNSLFSDLLSRISHRQELKISLSFDGYYARWTIRELPEFKTHVVADFHATLPAGATIHAEWCIGSEQSGKPDALYKINGDSSVNLEFAGLIPTTKNTDEALPENLRKIIGALKQSSDTDTLVQWLSSVRYTPPRLTPFLGAAPNRLTPNGEGAAQAVAYDEEESILPRVSRWYEEYFKQRLAVSPQGDDFRLMLEPLMDSPYQVDLADAGEGLIQVFPVLVACGMAGAGKAKILAVEEPESHLHPRLHASLASHFIALAQQEAPPAVLLETHSKIFLLTIQLEIARGRLSPDLVNIYWIRQLENRSSIAELIQFDELGRPLGNNWPRGVFSEEIEQARQVIEARRVRSKR